VSVLFLLLSLGIGSYAQSDGAADQPFGLEQTGERIDPAYAQLSAADLPARQTARQNPGLSSELSQLLTTWQRSQSQGIARADALDLNVAGDRVHVLFIMLDSAAAD